jgi:hypothetical protein
VTHRSVDGTQTERSRYDKDVEGVPRLKDPNTIAVTLVFNAKTPAGGATSVMVVQNVARPPGISTTYESSKAWSVLVRPAPVTTSTQGLESDGQSGQ